jgi:hypothetical protein
MIAFAVPAVIAYRRRERGTGRIAAPSPVAR